MSNAQSFQQDLETASQEFGIKIVPHAEYEELGHIIQVRVVNFLTDTLKDNTTYEQRQKDFLERVKQISEINKCELSSKNEVERMGNVLQIRPRLGIVVHEQNGDL